MSSEFPSFRPGQKLGRYDLLAPIARGGMGQVWVARLRGARGFHKLVAIKTLICLRGEEERMERMLLEEARIASLIQHSNVVQTLELGEQEGALYLVMEWVDGEPLSEVLTAAERIGGIPQLIAVNLLGQTLRGLQAAHELCDESGSSLGVVHLDVSPHNVLVSYSGVAKLADFGIARTGRSFRSEPLAHEVHGKFPYMAPEQILSGTIDQRTDVFAAGILLYLLTTGRHPFKDKGIDVVENIVSGDPAIRPSLLKPTYSRTLEAVVMKALDKDRDRRWPSAEEMRLALERGVPQAFGLGFEAQLRSFMTDLLGDRALAKREALRRAEAAADVLKENSLSVDSAMAPSAGSLRAIFIDRESPLELETPARESRVPTLRPFARVGPKRRFSPFRFAVAMLSLSAVAAALFALSAAEDTRSAAAPAASLVELGAPRPIPTTKVRALAPSASASTSAAVSATSLPSASAAARLLPRATPKQR
ncbi:MAG TPA: serine/threonine-protein kinase [Polyangiaceae bacterium]